MWALNNRTPYAAARNWIRDKAGVHHWLVAVKATFDIGSDGKLSLAEEQVPPILAPVYYGAPGQSSLRYDSDLLATKPSADVIVNAQAHAPGGKPVPQLDVTLQVDKLRKTLRVCGPRVYAFNMGFLTCTAAQPFTTQPIRYEWAYGGIDLSDSDPKNHRIDARNPIGRSFTTREANLKEQPAHSVEYPAGNAAKTGPAGFGAIDRSWTPRREYAGTYDDKWERTKKPLLPDDYDERFGMCAPADQLPGEPLHGGERVQLTNMTPSGSLTFELPKAYLVFTTRFGSRREDHRSKLSLVLIEPDDMRLMMVWQSALRVQARQTEQLDDTTIVEKPYLQ
jgi:hypothetical protein